MRKPISRKELERLYYSHTNRELCEMLDVSKLTLLKMIRDAGIKMKGKGYQQKYIIQ